MALTVSSNAIDHDRSTKKCLRLKKGDQGRYHARKGRLVVQDRLGRKKWQGREKGIFDKIGEIVEVG